VADDDRPRNREAETDARDRALFGNRAPEEALEEALALRGGNVGAAVPHLDEDRAVPLEECQLDAAAVRGELHRVGEEVVDHLPETVCVAVAFQARRHVDLELDGSVLRNRPHPPDRIGNDGGELDWAEVEEELRYLKARGQEQIANEPKLALCVPLCDLEELALLGVQPARGPIQEQVRVADDRRQRSPQLVRERGEELVLHAVGFVLHAF
jgi:hypothetical protein